MELEINLWTPVHWDIQNYVCRGIKEKVDSTRVSYETSIALLSHLVGHDLFKVGKTLANLSDVDLYVSKVDKMVATQK